MPTPHINATPADVAPLVLMPGDPLRAKYIAERFLENPVLFNNIRNVQGYTGTYRGKRVSVMASGMGMPSIGIYAYELYRFFGVETIVRIGTAGAISDDLELRDLILAQGACTNSRFAEQYNLPGTFAPIADFDTLCKAAAAAKAAGFAVRVGNVLSSDTFYDDADSLQTWKKMNVLAVEMEAAALYMTAARLNKKALAVLTVSDLPAKGTEISAEERERTLDRMITLALELAE